MKREIEILRCRYKNQFWIIQNHNEQDLRLFKLCNLYGLIFLMTENGQVENKIETENKWFTVKHEISILAKNYILLKLL